MLVAAEASGDSLGAGLAAALRRRLGNDVSFVGVGGSKMAEQGVQSPFDMSELSVLGWIEGLRAYPRVKRRVTDTVALARREQPDVAVLIDSWGFTVRVAKALREALPGVPLVKYVGPQVWASRPGRAKTLAASVDHLLAIHVFDAPFFEAEGLTTTFVGNPALVTDFSAADGKRFRQAIGAMAEEPVLLVLLGSRPGEVARLAEPFEEAVRRLKQDRPDLKVAVVVADTVRAQVEATVAGWPFRVHLVDGEAAKRDAMKGATLALACSGTVSTELALAGCPMVIAYRLDALSYFLIMRVVKTKYATLFNIAAQDFVAPELIQDRCTGEALAAELALRLDDRALRETQVRRQFEALDKMGRGLPDPAEKAADAVLKVLAERRASA
jgi:lipid-A-disaccharide synthase